MWVVMESCFLMIYLYLQAMADNDIRHAKILEALEAEKRKIAEDLAEIQMKRTQRVNQTPKTGRLNVPL